MVILLLYHQLLFSNKCHHLHWSIVDTASSPSLLIAWWLWRFRRCLLKLQVSFSWHATQLMCSLVTIHEYIYVRVCACVHVYVFVGSLVCLLFVSCIRAGLEHDRSRVVATNPNHGTLSPFSTYNHSMCCPTLELMICSFVCGMGRCGACWVGNLGQRFCSSSATGSKRCRWQVLDFVCNTQSLISLNISSIVFATCM